MRQHAHTRLWLLCLAFSIPAASRVWADDVTGHVTEIDAASRSITLADDGLTLNENFRAQKYAITATPDASFWWVSPDYTDIRDAVGDLRKATATKFEDISVGDRLLVRGQRTAQTILAAVIVDAGVSYPILYLHGIPNRKGTISVGGLYVHYSELAHPDHDFSMLCTEFIRTALRVSNKNRLIMHGEPFFDPPYTKDEALGFVEKGIREACGAALSRQATLDAEERVKQQKAAAEEAAIREQEAARDREAAAAKSEVDFRNGILVALHAAEEPDPFASIRGDFDLSGSDSRQWKTSLQLPDAEKCALLKTAAPTPTAASAWTFACMFRASGDGYERMVKSVQSVLNLPYVPDEKAVNMNQVFFADLTKPAWRFFAAKMKDAVGISVVAVRFAGGPATAANTTPFPTVPTMLPTDPTAGGQATPTVTGASISDEVEKIRSGRYTPLPPIQSMGSASSRNEMAVFEVRNDTAYTLTALFSGPIERRVEVAPGTSTSVELPPGAYKLAGRVNAPNVLPSYGEHTFDQSSSGLRFFLQ